MPIHIKETPEYFIFTYGESDKATIAISSQLSNEDIIFSLQGALDVLKPVLILKTLSDLPKEGFLKECKRHHVLLHEQRFIFLNYSVRNKLSTLSLDDINLHHFDHMYELLNKLLSKNS